MEEMSTRRTLPGKHASGVVAVGVYAWLPWRTSVPRSPARACRDPQGIEPDAWAWSTLPRSALPWNVLPPSPLASRQRGWWTCSLLSSSHSWMFGARFLSIVLSTCGLHSCIFTAGVVTDFAFAPSRFICASKISRWRGSASVSIWFRDPERQTQVTIRFKIVTVLSPPSSGPRIARNIWRSNSIFSVLPLKWITVFPASLLLMCHLSKAVAQRNIGWQDPVQHFLRRSIPRSIWFAFVSSVPLLFRTRPQERPATARDFFSILHNIYSHIIHHFPLHPIQCR